MVLICIYVNLWIWLSANWCVFVEGMEGEGETEHNHHGEKKSVLKKVKDKAKKIKDKIKHSGHAHDEEEYDDEDEETVIASGGHAAPSTFSFFLVFFNFILLVFILNSLILSTH